MNTSWSIAGPWTQERLERLRAWWAEGHSASQIATKFGGGLFTRNAIIGKVHRIGLDKRLNSNSQRSPRPRKPKEFKFGGDPSRRTAAAESPRTTRPPVEEALPLPSIPTASLLELERRHCRFILCDGGVHDKRYCGQKRAAWSETYCAAHHKICWWRPARFTPKHRGEQHG